MPKESNQTPSPPCYSRRPNRADPEIQGSNEGQPEKPKDDSKGQGHDQRREGQVRRVRGRQLGVPHRRMRPKADNDGIVKVNPNPEVRSESSRSRSRSPASSTARSRSQSPEAIPIARRRRKRSQRNKNRWGSRPKLTATTKPNMDLFDVPTSTPTSAIPSEMRIDQPEFYRLFLSKIENFTVRDILPARDRYVSAFYRRVYDKLEREYFTD